jgi:hypothetical protein
VEALASTIETLASREGALPVRVIPSGLRPDYSPRVILRS